MKLNEEARDKLKDALRSAVARSDLNYTQIGSIAGVHPSQASRICRGDFKTLSANVMQICKAVGVSLDQGAASVPIAQRRLERSIVNLWDRTSEDAERLLRLMRQLAEIRTHS